MRENSWAKALLISLKGFKSHIKENRHIYPIVLFIFCLIVIAINYTWRSIESRPPHWDMARHLYNSVNYFDYAKSFQLKNLITDYKYYPPLLYWVAIPFYFIFGASLKSSILVNSVFIFILAFATYGIGNRLWNRKVGFFAAVFILCSPMIVSQFKEFQLDAPATAMTALSLYLLMRSKEFSSRWWSLAFGLSLGLALLTKWTLIFVLILPIGYAVVIALQSDLRNKKADRFFNMLTCFLSAFFVMSFWYIQNLSQIYTDLINNGTAAGVREGDPPVGSFASNIWYFNNLVNNQLYIIPFSFFTVGLAYSFKNIGNYLRKNAYPLLLIIGTMFFFTFIRNKDARYTLPALVGVAIIAVYWIFELKDKKYKAILSLSIIVYCLVAFWLISFGGSFGVHAYNFGNYTIFAPNGYLIGSPTKENWQQEEIFRDISKHSSNKTLYTGYIPESMYFNSWGNQYYAIFYGINILDDPIKADFLVVASDNPIKDYNIRKVFKSYILPNGTTLELLEKS